MRIFVIVGLLTIMSCSHMKSGQYIRVPKGQSLKSLADKYNVSSAILKSFNKGRSPKIGDWYFIPQNRGIFGQSARMPASDSLTSAYLNSGRFIWPVPSSKRVSSKFGKRWGRPHEGIDIAARRGSSILAAADGFVVYSGSELGGYGNLTVIKHSGGYFTVYAHADKNLTRRGQSVHKGQVIATIGSTGRSTGPHLHFEVRYRSQAINPKKIIAIKQ